MKWQEAISRTSTFSGRVTINSPHGRVIFYRVYDAPSKTYISIIKVFDQEIVFPPDRLHVLLMDSDLWEPIPETRSLVEQARAVGEYWEL